MSNDGSKQYFSHPTTELQNNGKPPISYKALVDVAETNSLISTLIPDTGSVRSLDTNFDGDLLLLDIGNDSVANNAGYALYQASTKKLVSLNRVLKGCAFEDSAGNMVEQSECEYTTTPYSTTGNAESFTADGKHMLIKSISRFTNDRQQAVDDFILDVESATMYTLPTLYSANPKLISADASVMIGYSGFFNDALLIGKR